MTASIAASPDCHPELVESRVGRDAVLGKSLPLPVGWTQTRLSDVTRHHSGNSKLIKGKLSSEPGSGLFPAFSATGQDVWRDGFESDGDAVIVSAVGARCGKCFLASGKWSAIANTHVVWPKPEAIDRKFLWYRINDERFWIRSGTAQPFVVVRKTFERPFPLPPLPEQRRIVAEIEKQFTRLEAGVAALRRVQANLHRYRAAVLNAACEGRLVPTEADTRKKFETGAQLLQRILKQRRENWTGKGKYKEPAAPDTTGLPKLPEGWTWATVEQLGALGEQPVLTGPFGTSLGRADFVESGVPILTIGCLTDTGIQLDRALFVSPEKAKELERYRLRAGDLLFSRMASVGRAGIVGASLEGALINYHIMRLRLVATALLPKFYMAYVRGSSQVERYIRDVNHGATRDGINTEQLLNMPVALPPMAEQERIVAEAERRLSVVEELSALVTANLQRATRLRQSILQRAFEGRLI